jgi:glutathione synthase/RimK-type ligase-like ATP-grasp enzyme
MVQLALQAAKAVDIDYCGVDIIQAVSGEYYVLEVNSIPAWRGLQAVTDFNIAQVLVDDFLNKISLVKS